MDVLGTFCPRTLTSQQEGCKQVQGGQFIARAVSRVNLLCSPGTYLVEPLDILGQRYGDRGMADISNMFRKGSILAPGHIVRLGSEARIHASRSSINDSSCPRIRSGLKL